MYSPPSSCMYARVSHGMHLWSISFHIAKDRVDKIGLLVLCIVGEVGMGVQAVQESRRSSRYTRITSPFAPVIHGRDCMWPL